MCCFCFVKNQTNKQMISALSNMTFCVLCCAVYRTFDSYQFKVLVTMRKGTYDYVTKDQETLLVSRHTHIRNLCVNIEKWARESEWKRQPNRTEIGRFAVWERLSIHLNVHDPSEASTGIKASLSNVSLLFQNKYMTFTRNLSTRYGSFTQNDKFSNSICGVSRSLSTSLVYLFVLIRYLPV